MSQINYEKLKKALAMLQEGHEAWLECPNRPELRDSDRDKFRESCIQRFEVCFDMAYRHLKKHLQEEGVLGLRDASPKAIFRLGFENHLIHDAEAWFQYTNKRNDTSHEYNEAKANATLELVPHFITDAIDLYEAITGEEWND